MFEGFESGRVNVEGTEIAYVRGGSGPPVLLLHGFPQTKEMWARVAPQLAERYTVVCADLRGYGASGKPRSAPDSANYAFREMAADQARLMERLGFERFHGVGHDRGGRTLHRLAIDRPEALLSLAVLDIVPTHAMFYDTNRRVAHSYWHWYFLSQPEPFPETVIAGAPDPFYERCLTGWGATGLDAFDPEQLDAYRRAWRDAGQIHGSCSDYRAAISIDLAHDEVDLSRKVNVPTLVFYGSTGAMADLFDIPAEWRKRCADVHVASLPGGHFFVDQFPNETVVALTAFLSRQ